jgi:hypothetical protein
MKYLLITQEITIKRGIKLNTSIDLERKKKKKTRTINQGGRAEPKWLEILVM